MGLNTDDLLELFKNSYEKMLIGMSDKIGVVPERAPEAADDDGSDEMVAAMIGISGPGIKGTSSVIVDRPVIDGSYARAFANFHNHGTDYDTIELFGEFADTLAASVMEYAKITDISITPAQIMEGRNFKNLPTKKHSVKSFSIPFRLPEGMLYINTSIYM